MHDQQGVYTATACDNDEQMYGVHSVLQCHIMIGTREWLRLHSARPACNTLSAGRKKRNTEKHAHRNVS